MLETTNYDDRDRAICPPRTQYSIVKGKSDLGRCFLNEVIVSVRSDNAMVRKIRKLVWRHRERFLSLVMLPAFVFATLPHTACICADGHREEFCKAALCAAINSGSSTTACCGCRCCKSHGAPNRSCCQPAGCEPTKGTPSPVSGLTAKNGSCCHPFIEAPAPAIAPAQADFGSHQALIAAVDLPAVFVGEDGLQPTLDHNAFSTPPPLDAVIVFLHLTI